MRVLPNNSGNPVVATPTVFLTRHAEARIRQRGHRESDVEILLRFGREMSSDRLVLTDDAIEQEIYLRKKEIARLDRLRGMTAVIVHGRIVTVYKRGRRPRRHRVRWEE